VNSQQDSRHRFMVALAFEVPAGLQQAMAALIPQEQAHIRELAAQERMETICIRGIARASGWSCAATHRTTSPRS
jgi:hypothetical protein